MKKMLIVMIVAAFAVAACGKKKDAAKPGGDMKTPAGDMGSGSGSAAPAEGGGDKPAEPAPK